MSAAHVPGNVPMRDAQAVRPLRGPNLIDIVDEAGRESFPSSDPPAGWAGRDDGAAVSS